MHTHTHTHVWVRSCMSGIKKMDVKIISSSAFASRVYYFCIQSHPDQSENFVMNSNRSMEKQVIWWRANWIQVTFCQPRLRVTSENCQRKLRVTSENRQVKLRETAIINCTRAAIKLFCSSYTLLKTTIAINKNLCLKWSYQINRQ